VTLKLDASSEDPGKDTGSGVVYALAKRGDTNA
jgi:hypothetical protein